MSIRSMLRNKFSFDSRFSKSASTVLNFQPSLDGKSGPCDDFDYNFRTNPFWFNLLTPMIHILIQLGWKVEIEGKENLPLGPHIVMPNHVSHFDSFLAGPLMKRAPIIIGDEKLFKNRYFKLIAYLFNVFPVRKHTKNTAIVDYAINRVNRKGDSMLWFPEGQRNKHPYTNTMEEGKLGSGMLAQATNAAIIPCFISGSEHAMPLGGKLTFGRGPRTIKIGVKFGKPVYLDDLRILPPSKEVSKEAVRRIMTAIEELRPEGPYMIQKVSNKSKEEHFRRILN